MNILICDDIKSEAAKLERLLKESDFDVKISLFTNGNDALDFIRSGVFVDVCFLDIVMPEMNGVTLAAAMREEGFTGQIVFLSSSKEYGPEAFQVKALDYLLKPPRPENVRNILKKLVNNQKNDDSDGIIIKVSKIARHILFRELSHVEVIRHYVYIRLTNGEEIKMYGTLGEYTSQLLDDRRFAQCHRSYIVNMSEIASIDDREIIMRCGKNIPVSKSYPDLKKKFTKWIMEGSRK
jgi:DNA-binding LytR/AlgR family response regulator